MNNLHILQPKNKEIKNLFNHTNIGISFKSANTLQKLTKPRLASNTQEENKRGVYKFICNAYQMSYIGQRNWNLKQRY